MADYLNPPPIERVRELRATLEHAVAETANGWVAFVRPDDVEIVDYLLFLYEQPHVVILTDDGFSVEHALRCRPYLASCEYHDAAVATFDSDPGVRGRFFVESVDGRIRIGEPA